MNDYGRRSETKLVKDALVKQGYRDVKVTHGKGTAWGWLHVGVTISMPTNCFCATNKDKWGYPEQCHYCRNQWQDEYSKLGANVRQITGRHGEYGGNVNYSIHQEEVTPCTE